jgi:hypothetical protein
MIVCLGWGSLCWDPGSLPIDGEWQQDGPDLPLEFARVSQGGKITLVIADSGVWSPVLWIPLAVETLEDAVSALANRERVPSSKSIGRVPASNRTYRYGSAIFEWARQKQATGVVWTALKPGLSTDDRGRLPTLDELRQHVDQLGPEARIKALEYVQRAPAQIRTNYRGPLETILSNEVLPSSGSSVPQHYGSVR